MPLLVLSAVVFIDPDSDTVYSSAVGLSQARSLRTVLGVRVPVQVAGVGSIVGLLVLFALFWHAGDKWILLPMSMLRQLAVCELGFHILLLLCECTSDGGSSRQVAYWGSFYFRTASHLCVCLVRLPAMLRVPQVAVPDSADCGAACS